MKTRQLIKSFLNTNQSSRTNGLVALAGGLAAGVFIGVLFGTKWGKKVRNDFSDGFCTLFEARGTAENSNDVPHHTAQKIGKKPKSDIKSLIHQAHAGAAHTEQDII